MFRIPVDLFSFPERQCQRSQKSRQCCDKEMEDQLNFFLGLHPLFGSAMFKNKQCCRPKQPEKWIKRLRLRGFEPNDIKVTVKDDKITVHAQHTEGEDGNTDSFESKRILTVPDNVDLQQISSHLNVHGVLIIQAPYVQQEESSVKVSEGKSHEKAETMIEMGPDTNNQSEDGKSKHMEMDAVNDEKNAEEPAKPIVTFPPKTESVHVSEDNDEFEIIPNDNEPNLPDETRDENSLDSSLNVSDRGDNSFKLNLNLERFPTENIQVLHKDGSLIVKAEQKKEEDGMKMTEYYVSEHSLPENVDTSELKCMKRSDGRLIVQAPYQQTKGRTHEIE